MPDTSPFEWIIILLIVAGIAFAIWRGGQANPESTGALRRDLRKLTEKVGNMGGKMEQLDGSVKRLDGKVDQLERDSVTREDIADLKELINAKHEARTEAISRVEKNVDMIMQWLIDGKGRP